MKLVIRQSDLLKSVNIVKNAVSTKTTMEILECILIDASYDRIKLTANDMELGIETEVVGIIEQRGVIAINARLFSEIVRKLPDSDIRIETTSEGHISIECEKAKFDLACLTGEDFTSLPDRESDEYITLTEFSLSEVIRQVLFSIADSETNKIMTGALFEVDEDILKVVTLDGHRISIRNIKLAESYSYQEVIVPGKSLREIGKIIGSNPEAEIMIYFADTHVTFEFEYTRIVSRVIEGKYFNINQMLSNDFETKVTLNKREFVSSIERSMLLIRESDKKPIILVIEDDFMQMSITSQIGSMEDNIEIQKEGKDLRIGFNPKFLLDALRVIDEEEVDLYFMNSKAPCFIRDEESSYVYLILPVNIPAI